MSYTRPEFVKKYGGFISYAIKGTGLLQGTVIAQAIIESQGKEDGVWKVGASKLAKEANNYFGIKCHNWEGRGYNIDTGEQRADGTKYIDKNACFRKYLSVQDSITDYVKFLQSNSRYKTAGVFEATTVKDQAEALKRAGYATANNYASTIDQVYQGVRNYADKYNKYGFSGVVKSFVNNPITFVKRNPYAVAATTLLLVSGGIITYNLIKRK
jgi:flagellum-specific peptidoglycan hydrolase FlgJ